MTAAARRRRARLTRTIRWASTLTALAIATVLWSTPHGILSAALAAVFLGCFLILAATLGAFCGPQREMSSDPAASRVFHLYDSEGRLLGTVHGRAAAAQDRR